MNNTADFKKANEYTLKCMRVSSIVMIVAWILNILNIFIIDQKIVNHSLIGVIAFIACGYLVKFTLGFEKPVSNYLILFLMIGMITFVNVQLTYHVTLFMLFPLVCSILYNQNKYVTYTFILTCIGFVVSVVCGFKLGLCDVNMLILSTSTYDNEAVRLISGEFEINENIVLIILFFVLPRVMAFFAFSAVLKYIKNSIQEKTLREQESRQLAETERLANQAKSRFLAQMSHEIRTPINAVLGMNEMILHKAKDEEILDYSSNIKKAGKTLLVLINSILDFSKIEDGKMELLPVNYKVAEMIDNLRISVEQRAKDKGLELIINADRNLPCELYGDDMRISQIIINLLTNAVKYTKKGSVTLDIKEASRDGDRIGLSVSVTDTGIGIKEEDLPKLFTSFERIEEEKNRSIEGTGLGLAITTKMLAMMDSKLEVKSTYGEGSCFYFTVTQTVVDDTPMELDVAESNPHSVSESPAPGSVFPEARILVVDDNDMNLKVIKNLLGLFKVKPDAETSGAGAIERMRKNEYDIVFMDHMMPEMDGIETLARLREEKLVPDHTVVIALTANAIVGSRQLYLNASFTDYLSKPVELDQLYAALERYLPEDKKKKQETESFDDEVMEFSPDTAEDRKKRENDLIDNARKIGLNTESGLKYCAGDVSFYSDMLGELVSSHPEKEKKLADCYEKEDWKNYKVYVHALKSNLRSIGADELSGLARELEEAAEKGDIETIREKHGNLMTGFDKITSEIVTITK